MRSLAFAFLGVMLSSSLTLAAAPKDDFEAPPSGELYGEKDLSRLHMRCEFLYADTAMLKKSGKLSCEFTRVFVSVPTQAEIAKKVAEVETDFESSWKEGAAKGEMTMAAIQKDCVKSRRSAETDRQRYKRNNYSALLLPAFEELNGFQEHLCACKDVRCLHDAYKAFLLAETRVEADQCHISAGTGTMEFVKQGKSWISVEGSSTCAQSVTTTISPDTTSTLGGPQWKVRTILVPRADAEPGCPTQVMDDSESPGMYPPITLTCKTITLY